MGREMDLDADLRTFLQSTYEGMRLRPGMYGRAHELEAMWHILLSVECLLLDPKPEPQSCQDAFFKAREPIQRRNKWPGPIGLACHGLSGADLMVVLGEMRENYFKALGCQPPVG